MHKPYTETEKRDENHTLRLFKKKTSSEDLVWHRDRENRLIWSAYKTGWKFQFDNELPREIPTEEMFGIYIPKYTYHRLIKSSDDLTLHTVKEEQVNT